MRHCLSQYVCVWGVGWETWVGETLLVIVCVWGGGSRVGDMGG